MNATAELPQLVSQRTWDKELNLWVGPTQELCALLEGVKLETLDLLDLILDDVPADDDDIRRYLAQAIRQHVRAISRERGQRMVLIVRSAGCWPGMALGSASFTSGFATTSRWSSWWSRAVAPT
jgi:hypothetical protein